ncbi:hypothetical protein CVIRNUC_005223 [Coccomyxa viridis]|uniref:Uncharacterized protein n=1 Tax=Coccomyxa viridis TaxID=1274662 RepID=A0AAV1I7L1_9CHLO|nr:hypothetical protein CVIRNUC_005223 [Coccomyxa viridis]
MAIVKAEERPPYLDLDNAVEVEEKLTRALDAVQAHSNRLQQKQESGEDLSLEDTYHLQSLLQKLKMIEKRQATLQEYVEADVKKKQGENEAAIAVKNARQKEAMQIVKEKAARPATMQELREMNQVELTSDDNERRWKEANTPNKITPSGGLIGFKVADDLLTKEYKEDQEQFSHLSGNNKG